MAERRLAALLRLYAALFLVAGVLYFLLPGTTLTIANAISRATSDLPPIAISPERFWVVLTFSLLVTLAYLSWEAQKDVRGRLGHVRAILLSKLVSTVCYVALFALERHLAYLLGGLTDGALFAAGLLLYRPVAAASAPRS